MRSLLLILVLLYTTFSVANEVTDSLYTVYQNTENPDSVRFSALHNFAWTLIKIDSDSAYQMILVEIDLAQQNEKAIQLAQAYNSMALYYTNKGNHYLSNEYRFKALKLMHEAGDMGNVTLLEFNIGVSYFNLKKFDKAEEHCKIALKEFEKNGNEQNISVALNNLGVIYTRQKKYPEALTTLHRTLAMRIKSGYKDGEANCYSNIGFVFLELARLPTDSLDKRVLFDIKDSTTLYNLYLDSAQYYFNNSILLFAQNNNLYDLSYAYIGLAGVNEINNDKVAALKNFKKGYEIGQDIDILEIKAKSAEGISRMYNKLGNVDSSYFYLQQNLIYIEELNNKDKMFDVGKQMAEYRYNLEKEHLKEINILTKEKADSKIEQLILLFILISFIVIGVGLTLFIRNKLKSQQRINASLIEGIESERERISKDLHDDIGQQLSLIKSELSKTEGNSLSQIVNNTIDSVREMSKDLYPTILKSIGLLNAVENLFDKVEKKSKLFTSFEIDENLDTLLSDDRKLHIYRLVQECVNNTLKHAKNATSVRLIITVSNVGISIEYLDNGVGFEKSDLKEEFFLRSLKERVKILKGTIKIKKPKKGVNLLFVLPKDE